MKFCLTYILDEAGRPVAEPDFVRWAEWLETNKRSVAFEEVAGLEVSTVFLGITTNFSGAPLLWETMIFGGAALDQSQWRCAGSREQAEAMHAKAVAYVKENAALAAILPPLC